MKKILPFSILVVLAFILLLQTGYAQSTVSWASTNTGGDWQTAANWGGAAPVDGDYVVFNFNTNSNISITNIPVIALNRLTFSNSGSGVVTLQGASDEVIVMQDDTGNDLVISSGTLEIGSALTLDLSGSDMQTSISGTLRIASGGKLNMQQQQNNQLAGSGTVSIMSGGTFIIGSPYGIKTTGTTATDGAVITTTRSFSNSANYAYNTTGSANTGNALPTTVNNFEVAGGGTVTLDNSLQVNGELFLNEGTLAFASKTLTINGTTNINAGALSGTGTSSIVIQGTGSGIQLPSGISIPNLTLNNSNGATLVGNATVTSTLTLTSGALTVGGSNTLTINGSASAITITSGTISGGNVSLGGSGAVNFPAATVTNFTVNRSGAVVTMTGALTINGNLTLTSGSVSIGSNTLTLNGSTASGTVTGSTTSNLVIGGSGNLTLPTINTGLNDFTVNRTNSSGQTVTLGSNVTVNGTLALTNGILSLSTRTLTLNGTISQTSGSITGGTSSNFSIGGSGANLTIPSISGGVAALTVNRANGVTLGANLTVEGTLTMTSGDITTGAFTLTHGTTAERTLSRASGAIIGTYAYYKAATATSRTIPVATSTYYRPVVINYTSAPTTAGTITVSHTDGTSNSPLPSTLDDAGYSVNNRSVMYWTLSHAAISGGTYSLDLKPTGITNVSDVTKLRIVRSADGGSSFGLVGTHSNGGADTTAKRTGISGNNSGRFYIGSQLSDNQLPVELTSFDLKTVGTKVVASWKTGSEKNNAGFEIYRKENSNFELIGSYKINPELIGLGTSAIGKNYSFTDSIGVIPGKTYKYYIADISLDGRRTNHPEKSITIEEIVSVDGMKDIRFTDVFPNPAAGIVKVNFALKSESNITLDILSVDGRVVEIPVQNERYMPGFYERTVDTSKLPKGSYVLRVKTGTGQDVQKLIVIE